MLDNPELILGLFFVVFSGGLVFYSTGFFGFVSPPGIFYGLFIVFIYVGTVLLDFGIDLWYAASVSSHPLILGVAIFMFALGTVVPRILFQFDSFAETRRYAHKGIRDDYGRNIETASLLIATLLIIWISVRFSQVGSPLLSGISYLSWASSVSWMMVGITLVLPFLSMLLLTFGYIRTDTVLWRAGVVGITLSLVFMILTSRRYPVLDFGIWAVCLVSYLKFRNYTDLTKILLFSSLLAVPFFVGVQIARHPHPGVLEDLLTVTGRYIRNRIFLSEATGVNYILTTFPQQNSFTGGRYLADQLVSILPGFNRNLSLGNELFNSVLESNGGYLPPTLVGELYADFGWLGFVGLFVWGFLLQTVLVAFVRTPKTPLTVTLFAISSGLLGRSLIQGVLTPVNRIKYLSLIVLPLLLLSLKLPELRVTIGERKQ